ncbi:MAG TPA: hypothetical protein VF755_22870, partial [Catenuloplanes sp.]
SAPTITLTLPEVSVSGGITVFVDSAAASPVRFAGTGLIVTVAGQPITGVNASFERTTTAAGTVTTLTLRGGAIAVAGAASTVLSVSGVAGSLVVSAAGVAGRLAATLQGAAPAGVTFGGSLDVAVNTTPLAVGDLPAGPYVRVDVRGAVVTVAGQAVTADLSFEQVSAGTGPVVRAAVSKASASFGAAGSPLVRLTNGRGSLLLPASGLAAELSGTVTVTVPGVSVSGALTLQLNSTGAQVNELFTVAGLQETLVLPAGAAGAAYVRFAGSPLVVDVLGQQLIGGLTITSSGSATTISGTGLSLVLGGGVATLSGAAASLTVSPTGMTGSLTGGTVTLTVPGVTLLGTLSADIDTATGRVRIGGASVTLTVAGVSISSSTGGGIWVERRAGTGTSTPTVVVTFSGATLGFGPVTVTASSGTLQATSAGVAGSLTGVATFSGSFLTGSLGVTIAVNTGSDPAAGQPAGSFLRVQVTVPDSAPVTLRNTALAPLGTVAGSFSFERQAPAGGLPVTVVGVSNARVTIAAGPVTVTSVTGALVVAGAGVAGYLSGTAS